MYRLPPQHSTFDLTVSDISDIFHGLALMQGADAMPTPQYTETGIQGVTPSGGYAYISPQQWVQFLRDTGFSLTMLDISTETGWVRLDPVSSFLDTQPKKWRTAGISIRPYVEAVEEAGIYYTFSFWRMWYGVLRRNEEALKWGWPEGVVEPSEARDYLVAMAHLVGQEYGDSPYWVGMTFDGEFDGWNAVVRWGFEAAFPGGKDQFHQWLFDPDFPNGFCATLWQYKPDLIVGIQPNYVHFPVHDDPRVSSWSNHLNLLGGPHEFWDMVQVYQTGAIGKPQLAGGTSIDQADCGIHYEIDHTWHYVKNWLSEYGVREHVLWWILYNPRYVGVAYATYVGFEIEPCPVCGRTKMSWSAAEINFLKRIGDKLATVPYTPDWVATWGDLANWWDNYPDDGSQDVYIDHVKGGSNPVADIVAAEAMSGIAYMLDAKTLWIVNYTGREQTVTIQFAGQAPQTITLAPYDFETVSRP